VPGGTWPLPDDAIAVRACPGRGTVRNAEVTVPLTQHLRGIIEVINAQQPQSPDAFCPSMGGSGFVLAFQHPDGSVQSVSGDFGGCGGIKAGGQRLGGAREVWTAYAERLLATGRVEAPGEVDCWPGGEARFPGPLAVTGDDLTDALLCVDADGMHRSVALTDAQAARMVAESPPPEEGCVTRGPLRLSVAARSPWGPVSVPIGCGQGNVEGLQSLIDAARTTDLPAVGQETDPALLPRTWRALSLLGEGTYAESLWVDPKQQPDPWDTTCLDRQLIHLDVPGWAWGVATDCRDAWVMVRQRVTDPWLLLESRRREDDCGAPAAAAPATLPVGPVAARLCALESVGMSWIAPQDVLKADAAAEVAGIIATLEPRDPDWICGAGGPAFDLVVTLDDGKVRSYRNDGRCNEFQTADGLVHGADRALEAFLAAVEKQRRSGVPESIERVRLSCSEGADRFGRRTSLIGDPRDLVRAISCWRPNDAEPPPWRQSRPLTRAEVRLITGDLSRRTTEQKGYDETCGEDSYYWQDIVGQTRWGDVVTLRGVCRTFLVEGRSPETYWHPSPKAQALLDALR